MANSSRPVHHSIQVASSPQTGSRGRATSARSRLASLPLHLPTPARLPSPHPLPPRAHPPSRQSRISSHTAFLTAHRQRRSSTTPIPLRLPPLVLGMQRHLRSQSLPRSFQPQSPLGSIHGGTRARARRPYFTLPEWEKKTELLAPQPSPQTDTPGPLSAPRCEVDGLVEGPLSWDKRRWTPCCARWCMLVSDSCD
jgi:hypothetical protein